MKTKYFYYVLFALLFMSSGARAQGIFLHLPDATTGKGPAGHTDEVAILAISGGLSRSNGADPSFNDYYLTKDFDASSIDLQTYATNGTASPLATIKFYSSPGGVETLVLTIELRNARITSYQASGTPCGTCPILTESISVSFDAVRIGTYMWDLTNNTATF